MNKEEKFSALFTNTLMFAGIEFANGYEGDSYVVYNEKGMLFFCIYNKASKKYLFVPTSSFLSEYEKYGLSKDDNPSPVKVYESVAFSYKIRNIVYRAKKDFSALYKDILIDSDIIFQMRGDFETYMVINSGFAGYAIGFNPKTQKYGFKRYDLINTLYKICNIPTEKKPDYASLYKSAKDYYIANVAIENIQHLYDF